MSILARLCEAAEELVQLELDIGDVFTGYQRGDEILATAWPRRESLWDTIQQLAKDAIAEAASDPGYSTIEIRVSDLMVHCRALYLAGRHIHHRKGYNSEGAVKAANENSRRITELSRQVEDAISRLRLLIKAGGAPPESTATKPLNPTKKRILSLCRRRALPGPAIAHKLELSYDHIRRVLGQLTKANRLTNGPDGYRTVRAT
jgi:hypothetical protein